MSSMSTYCAPSFCVRVALSEVGVMPDALAFEVASVSVRALISRSTSGMLVLTRDQFQSGGSNRWR
jgi:hypothetical protein